MPLFSCACQTQVIPNHAPFSLCLWQLGSSTLLYDRQKDYLRDMISRFSGDDLLVIYLTRERSVKRCEREGGIRADAHVLEELSMRFGQDNVALKERK